MGGLRERAERELRGDILPFWLKYAVDDEFGGFHGQITNDLKINPWAHKGLILNARILWTFSKAYKVTGMSRIWERRGGRTNICGGISGIQNSGACTGWWTTGASQWKR